LGCGAVFPAALSPEPKLPPFVFDFSLILLSLGGIGLLFDGLAWWSGHRHFKKKTLSDPSIWPYVLMIKPVAGLDIGARENFLSLIHQDYPHFSIVFVVGSIDDPVLPLIEELCSDFPDCVSLKIVDGPRGTNRKISNVFLLMEQNVFPDAPYILLNDSDIRVGADYLRSIMREALEDPKIGMVTCFQRGNPTGPGTSQMASIMLNTEAIPQGLLAAALAPIDFAYGPTMLMRREALLKMGGFGPIRNLLADDFHLAQGIIREGFRIVLARYIVDAQIPDQSWRSFWEQERRWVITYRSCRPLGYSFSIILRPFPFLFSSGVLFELAGDPFLLIFSLFLWCSHLLILSDLSKRFVSRPIGKRQLHLLFIREILSLALYFASFGHQIIWRGRRFSVLKGGQLMEFPKGQS
jgi:ceramide glucosyltransferase